MEEGRKIQAAEAASKEVKSFVWRMKTLIFEALSGLVSARANHWSLRASNEVEEEPDGPPIRHRVQIHSLPSLRAGGSSFYSTLSYRYDECP